MFPWPARPGQATLDVEALMSFYPSGARIAGRYEIAGAPFLGGMGKRLPVLRSSGAAARRAQDLPARVPARPRRVDSVQTANGSYARDAKSRSISAISTGKLGRRKDSSGAGTR